MLKGVTTWIADTVTGRSGSPFRADIDLAGPAHVEPQVVVQHGREVAASQQLDVVFIEIVRDEYRRRAVSGQGDPMTLLCHIFAAAARRFPAAMASPSRRE